MRKKLNIAVTVLLLSTLTACGSATGSKPTSIVNQNSNSTQPVTEQPTETKYLTRAEAMSLIYKTLNPDTKPPKDNEFSTQVGNTEYDLYAQEYKREAYLNITDSSLDKTTYNSVMSRGEAIYLLMNRFYAEELDTYKADNVKLEDAEDKAEEQKSGKTRIEELSAMLNNPTEGVEHNMYKALALAYDKGIIDTVKTRWNEGITKEELIELIIKVEVEFNKAGVIKGGLVDTEQNTEVGQITEEERQEIEGDGEALVTDEGDVMIAEGSGDGHDVEIDPAEYYGFGYKEDNVTGVLEKEDKVENKDKKVKKGKKKVVVKKGAVKKKKEQSKKLEEAKKKAEQVRKAEEAKKETEQVRKAEEAKKEEQAKKAEQAKKIEEAKKAEEAKKKAEQTKKAEEAKKKAEQAKKAEEAKKKAEEAKKKADQTKKKTENKTGNKGKYKTEREAMRKSLLGVKGKVLARDDLYGAPLVIKQGDRLLLSDWQKKIDAYYGIERDAKGWRLYSPDRGIYPDHLGEGTYDRYCEYRQEEIDKMVKWQKEHADE